MTSPSSRIEYASTLHAAQSTRSAVAASRSTASSGCPAATSTPAAPVCVVVPPAEAEVSWRVTATLDGIEAGGYDAIGRLLGFALVGEAAMARRSDWVKACGQAQAA